MAWQATRDNRGRAAVTGIAVSLLVAAGCGGDGGSGAVGEDLTGKSNEVQTNIIVDTLCETTCPSYGIYCVAPDPMRGAGGGCRAEVTEQNVPRCKQEGRVEVMANLGCAPLDDDEVAEANACVEWLLTHECEHTFAELQAIADDYNAGRDAPEMIEPSPWPDTCDHLGELIWNPAPPECLEPEPIDREGEGAALICAVMEECYPAGTPEGACEEALTEAGPVEELRVCADCLRNKPCLELGPLPELGEPDMGACGPACDFSEGGSIRAVALDARER